MKNDILNIRKDFPIFNNIESLIYFDSASTTQKPQYVINKLLEFYTNYNANVHRGSYGISDRATLEYENSRRKIASFINANKNEIIFTKGTTESINLISYTFGMQLEERDEVIISEMEHHSNIVPWQMLIKKKKIKLQYIPVNKNGELDLLIFKKLINNRTKLISITHMSNVLGTINPIKKITRMANKFNIPILVDAAQSVSHISIDVKKINCDFLVFSGHKMMGPTGVGILYIKKNMMKKIEPFLRGGSMIHEVKKYKSTWNNSPWRYEAGTPNIAQVIGLASSIEYIHKIGLSRINKHETKLLSYLLSKLKKINGIIIYGQQNESGPIVSFNILNYHPFDISKLLDTFGIAIRSGHHCAQLLMENLKINYSNRISLYMYNNLSEIDYFINCLKKVIKILK